MKIVSTSLVRYMVESGQMDEDGFLNQALQDSPWVLPNLQEEAYTGALLMLLLEPSWQERFLPGKEEQVFEWLLNVAMYRFEGDVKLESLRGVYLHATFKAVWNLVYQRLQPNPLWVLKKGFDSYRSGRFFNLVWAYTNRKFGEEELLTNLFRERLKDGQTSVTDGLSTYSSICSLLGEGADVFQIVPLEYVLDEIVLRCEPESGEMTIMWRAHMMGCRDRKTLAAALRRAYPVHVKPDKAETLDLSEGYLVPEVAVRRLEEWVTLVHFMASGWDIDQYNSHLRKESWLTRLVRRVYSEASAVHARRVF